MYLAPPTFVLERRINQSIVLVNRAVSTGGPFDDSLPVSLPVVSLRA